MRDTASGMKNDSAAAAVSQTVTEESEPPRKKAKMDPATSTSSTAASAASASAASSHSHATDSNSDGSVEPAIDAATGKWRLPSLARVWERVGSSATLTLPVQHAEDDAKSSKKRGSSEDVNDWLLLMCNNAVDKLQIAGKSSKHSITVDDPQQGLAALLSSFGARADARDPSSYSTVHWLMFDAIESGIGNVIEPTLNKVDEEEREPDVSQLTRYIIEPELTVLLKESMDQGFTYQNTEQTPEEETNREDDEDEEENEEEKTKEEENCLLNLQDSHGNTPLHWCVHYERVDLVSLLILHGADPSIANKKGLTPYDMCDWDGSNGKDGNMQDQDEAKSANDPASTPSPSSGIVPHPLTASLHPEIYASPGHLTARRWGLRDGLEVSSCKYRGESASGAIRRLLFQQKLWLAVDRGDNGDLDGVRKLVDEWLTAEAAGCRMFPLVYRPDCAFFNPLSQAVAYESDDDKILRQLLRLPHVFGIQSKNTTNGWPVVHRAALANRQSFVDMLVSAGAALNIRDITQGTTALHVVIGAMEPVMEKSRKQEDKDKLKHNRELLETATHLLNAGIDARVAADDGSTALAALVFVMGKRDMFEKLIGTVSKEEAKAWINKQNIYGNTVMHYALFYLVDLDVLRLLHSFGGSVDSPTNRAGQTPLDVWTGVDFALAPYVAEILNISLDDVKKKAQATKLPKAHSRVVTPDVTQGKESSPIRGVSEYADPPPSPFDHFVYVTTHHPTGPIAEAFMARYNPRAPSEELRLQEAVNGFTRELGDRRVHFIKPSWLEVRMTEQKRWGLFTTRHIPKPKVGEEEYCIEIVGELITEEEAAQRETDYLAHNQAFILPVNKLTDRTTSLLIDQRHYANITRFINHSCSPNLEIWGEWGGRVMSAYTTMEIPAGTELCLDYSLTPGARSTMICRCATKACKGFSHLGKEG